MKKAQFLLDAGAWLGEGPVWDDIKSRLLWVDIDGKKLHFHYFESGENLSLDMEQKIGAVFLTKSGGIVAALQDGLYMIDEQGNAPPELIVRNPEDNSGNRFNDGKCDRMGRIWIGTLNMNSERGKAGLYRVDPDGTCTRMLEGVSVSNGICWSHDDRYMYYVDTPSGFLWRFDFDIDKGTISNRTPVIDYRSEPGNFDGMTIDSEGMLWIAHWGGFRISRWDPVTREKIDSIILPVPNVSSCTFGGRDLNRLYITTAVGMDMTVKQDYPESGCLFVYDTDVKGMKCNRFGM